MAKKIFYLYAVIVLVFTVYIMQYDLKHLWWIAIPFLLMVVGFYDVFQKKSAILRNFPLLGHMRTILSEFGPEIRQYFVESDTNGTPFNRLQRRIIEARANGTGGTHPFGTELDVYQENYEWMPHSIYPVEKLAEVPRVLIGSLHCEKPYSASILNISAMSYGSLSKNAILALNKGAKKGSFYHNTGEGGIAPYHLEPGGDLVYQVGTGYFGCRASDGNFDPEKFRITAAPEQVRMIELKLSQGAKPGHGGILPSKKNTEEVAKIRGIEPFTVVHSPAHHKAFSDAQGLLDFVDLLRQLSGGKPTGFKLCIGFKKEFEDICRLMSESGQHPDFISIDGGEGGTGAAPLEFTNSVGMPLEDGLVFAVDTLKKYGLKEKIKIIASGKVATAFDIYKLLSLGADVCSSARGMMMALGCIQALECDRNSCPVGVATQEEHLMRGLVVEEKFEKVFNFHKNTLDSFLEIIAAAGISDLKAFRRNLVFQRTNTYSSRSYEEIYPSEGEGYRRV